MSDFFHGWRRKLGMATLAIACVLMAGWSRSFYFHDEVSFNETEFRESLSSHLGRLYWIRVRFHHSDNSPFLHRIHWQNTRLQMAQVWKEEEDAGPYWKWHFCGIGVRKVPRSDGEVYYSLVVIPYWSVVIPLTLLSAYLLLIKSTRKKNAEPVAIEKT